VIVKVAINKGLGAAFHGWPNLFEMVETSTSYLSADQHIFFCLTPFYSQNRTR